MSATSILSGALEPLGLYIHWPFCLSKCPYCDFNSHVATHVETARWEKALQQEMTFMARLTPNHQLVSIFFGGGTPSLMDPALVYTLIEHAKSLWLAVDTLEITLEANPTTIEAKKMAAFSQKGVNRLSLGVQSLDDKALAVLGRTHSAQQARYAIGAARDHFDRFSFDLMYGRPHQGVAQWAEELDEALSLAPLHVSLYQLTYEPGTLFYTQFQRGEKAYPPEHVAIDFDRTTTAITQKYHLPRYEISNYAQPEHRCRHNMLYWQSQAYVGIGPGAHGRIHRGGRTWALQTVRAPQTWLSCVEQAGHGLKHRAPVKPQERFTEILMMGLRLNQGVDLQTLVQQTGHPLSAWIPHATLKQLAWAGRVRWNKRALWLTPKGRLCLNAIVERLVSKN